MKFLKKCCINLRNTWIFLILDSPKCMHFSFGYVYKYMHMNVGYNVFNFTTVSHGNLRGSKFFIWYEDNKIPFNFSCRLFCCWFFRYLFDDFDIIDPTYHCVRCIVAVLISSVSITILHVQKREYAWSDRLLWIQKQAIAEIGEWYWWLSCK